MTTKIVDISDEIYRELGEPSDISISSIGFWLRTNLGKLNILINKTYSINSLDLEVESIVPETFSIVEKTILKKLYNIHYYDRQILNLIGKSRNLNIVDTSTSGTTNYNSTSNNIEISEHGFSYKKDSSLNTKTANETIRANTQFIKELGLNFIQLKKQENEELNSLIRNYNLNKVSPLQIAGDDTVEGLGRPQAYGQGYRNLDYL